MVAVTEVFATALFGLLFGVLFGVLYGVPFPFAFTLAKRSEKVVCGVVKRGATAGSAVLITFCFAWVREGWLRTSAMTRILMTAWRFQYVFQLRLTLV